MKRAAPRRMGGTAQLPSPAPSTLLIACGALAKEIVWLIRANHWRHLTIACLPAHLHNTPQLIPDAVRQKIKDARADPRALTFESAPFGESSGGSAAAGRGRFQRIAVLYGDCGTGGLLDKVLAEEGVERIDGPHCYAFFAGQADFDALMDEQSGSFFLTDYLTRHFDRLVIRGLGLDRHPELLPDYFGNYTRLVYLAQTDDPELTHQAQAAARRLGLEFARRFTGYGGIAPFIAGTAADPPELSSKGADSSVGARGSTRATEGTEGTEHGDADHRLLA